MVAKCSVPDDAFVPNFYEEAQIYIVDFTVEKNIYYKNYSKGVMSKLYKIRSILSMYCEVHIFYCKIFKNINIVTLLFTQENS